MTTNLRNMIVIACAVVAALSGLVAMTVALRQPRLTDAERRGLEVIGDLKQHFQESIQEKTPQPKTKREEDASEYLRLSRPAHDVWIASEKVSSEIGDGNYRLACWYAYEDFYNTPGATPEAARLYHDRLVGKTPQQIIDRCRRERWNGRRLPE